MEDIEEIMGEKIGDNDKKASLLHEEIIIIQIPKTKNWEVKHCYLF